MSGDGEYTYMRTDAPLLAAAAFRLKEGAAIVLYGKPYRPWYHLRFHFLWKFSRNYRQRINGSYNWVKL